MFTNRRKFSRINIEGEECTVIIDGCEMSGNLADESIDGARVTGLDFLMIPHGKPISIRHRDGSFFANIRNLERDAETGQIIIGVSRNEELSELKDSNDAMLLNAFLAHDGHLIACIPVTMKSKTLVTVQLWDGMQFDVPRDSITSLTRNERFEQLGDEATLRWVAEMYAMGTSVLNYQKRKIVFEFEFGHLPECASLNAAAV